MPPEQPPPSILEIIAVIGGPAGVVVAVAALVWSIWYANSERRRQLRVERYRSLVELLAAFEARQALRPRPLQVAAAGERPDLERANATFRAQLYGSPESLPIARSMLEHIPFGNKPSEAAELQRAPKLGDAESETDLDQAIRGEIVGALAQLRTELGSRKAAGRIRTR